MSEGTGGSSVLQEKDRKGKVKTKENMWSDSAFFLLELSRKVSAPFAQAPAGPGQAPPGQVALSMIKRRPGENLCRQP